MRNHTRRTAFGLAFAVALTVTACDGEPPTAPGGDAVAEATLADRVSAPGQFSFYALHGLASADARMPCLTPRHDDFDFWVGDWDVEDTQSGVPAGTNRVVEGLDNCLVEESWTAVDGSRGRSMNAWDAATGEWSQYWIDQFGFHLRLTGGLDGESMLMLGNHKIVNPAGVLVPIVHRIRWTPFTDGTVRQFWDAAPNNSPDFFLIAFDGTYVPASDFQPAPPLQQSFCTDLEYDQLDFLLGSWRVETPAGRELGTATVGEDLENCLLEEDFASTGGYAAQSFFGWDSLEEAWFRSHLDTEGNRIVLRGGLEGDAMVLEGERPRSGGEDLRVRITIRGDGDERVVQSWETSTGSGAWKMDGAVVFVRS